MCTNFVSCSNIHYTQFWFFHYYLLHTIFVSQVDIACTLHSMCCTMPKFSMPHDAPTTTLSCHNLYSHYVCTKNISLHFANIAHPMPSIIMYLHTMHNLLCLCTPHNAKFSVRTCTSTFFHVVPKFSTCTRTQTFFCAVPKFSARTHTPTFFCVVPKFSARTCTPDCLHAAPKFNAYTRMPTFFREMPKFTAHISTPIFSTRHQNLVCTPERQYFPHYTKFYSSQNFHCASFIFSVHIHFYAHRFLLNFAVEVGAFS
jgi:hypothetical protein